MAKDPAFLFYYDRFLSGTLTMTDEEVGQYIRLMCIQANKGFITKKDMMHICKTYVNDVCLKFDDIGDGKFANKVLSEIVDQRKNYTESRRNNRKGKKSENICKTYDEHMVNVNVNKDVIEDKLKGDKIDFTKPDIDGDEIIFPIDTAPMRQLWATWKESRWRNHEVRYSFAGEQSALKQLQSMDFHKIENTIQQAIAGKWKNLYPESNGKQQQWRGKRNQGTAIGADAVFGPQECGDL